MRPQPTDPAQPHTHFPLENLPYCAFRTQESTKARLGVRWQDWIVDLAELGTRGWLGDNGDWYHAPTLNVLMAAGRETWQSVRADLQDVLGNTPKSQLADILIPIDRTQLTMPVEIGDYTDFYASREHAQNVGTMFRGPENALPPNWLHLPIGYHGRASSVVLSETPIRRPTGQFLLPDADTPTFAPTRELDFELEMGFLVGTGNSLGSPISIDQAEEYIFGLVLVNDWSARDIQRWEYRPLGPFLAKNFATSISPYIVPMEALAPFRRPAPTQTPSPLDYLRPVPNAQHAFDISLSIQLQPQNNTAHTISRSNTQHLYWTIAQQIAHHSVTGCNMRPGDLLASGTISGPTPDSYGSMLELAWRGERPLTLPNGETRTFLQDGDTITLTGWCKADDLTIGFGEVTGTILPATG